MFNLQHNILIFTPMRLRRLQPPPVYNWSLLNFTTFTIYVVITIVNSWAPAV